MPDSCFLHLKHTKTGKKEHLRCPWKPLPLLEEQLRRLRKSALFLYISRRPHLPCPREGRHPTAHHTSISTCFFSSLSSSRTAISVFCDKRVLYLSRAVHARSVHVEHLARSRQLVAANLHKIIHHLDLLDVLRRVLPHSVARGLRLQVRKLRLPIPQQTLTDIQHLSHFLNGVVQFSRFFGLQGHDTSSKKSDTKDRSGAEKELFSAVAALFFCKSSENYVPLQNFLSISHR